MSQFPLRDRVALVTGSSQGIGRATAIAMGRAGAKVIVNYRSNPQLAEEVVAAIREAGSDAIAVSCDVSDQSAVEAMVAEGVAKFGRLDICVTNAVYSDRELFYLADMAGFKRTIDVTMWGAFYAMRASTQQMIKQGQGGSIVIVSSPHAFIPAPRAMAYNMSKAALEHAARTAAIEVAEFKIRVNVVQPGWTDTPGELKFASRDTLDSAGAKIPLGRLGTAEEMAQSIMFLVDPRNEYITGAQLLVDGGISLPWWANRGSAAPA